MGRVRWKARSPLCVDGGLLDPGIQRGSGRGPPEAVSGSFLAIFVCWRAKRGTSPATGPDFWEATRKPEPPASRAKRLKIKPLMLDTPGGRWTPTGVQVWTPESGSQGYPPCVKGAFDTPDKTKRFNPIGGVSMAISILMTTMIAKWIGSIPNSSNNGRTSGTMISTIDSPSRTVPKSSITRLINTRKCQAFRS